MKALLGFSMIAILLTLVGCSSSREDDIRQWLVEERNQTRPKVKPIPAPKQFKPEAYVNAAAIEPFLYICRSPDDPGDRQN